MLRRIYWPQFWHSLFLPGYVQTGPFAGMRYGRFSTGSVVLPKLLGTYESELHPTLSNLPFSAYDHCVDVGAGEGYYAVGLCYRHPHLHMTAFESNSKGRRRIHRLARMNGVSDRIAVLGHCGPDALGSAFLPGKRCLLIMDVEGFEASLLDPRRVKALREVDFIVEVHPDYDPALESILWSRFDQTHDLHIIRRQPRECLPGGVRLPARMRKIAAYLMEEFRGPQCWLIGRANQFMST